MIARGIAFLVAALLLAGLAVTPALAEDAMAVARSEAPQTITGEGDRTLLIEGPFGIEWQSAGRIGVSAAPDKPGQTQGGGPAVLSGAGADGMSKGRMNLSGEQRYRVSITASGPWQATVSW